MLFWIILAVLIGGIVWRKLRPYDDWYIAPILLSGLSLIVSIVIIMAMYTGLDGCIEHNKVHYDSLVYQLENGIYENDNDLGKRALIEDVMEWNEDLAWNLANQNNFWIGIYIPDIYDQFEPIPLELIQ